jgi:hypothetical protein
MSKFFESGILDRTRLVSNVLMFALLCGNIYFSTMFITNLNKTEVTAQDSSTLQIKVARSLKDFINKVLAQEAVSFEDRVMLENDILQIHDPVVTSAWNSFVASKTAKEGQTNAVKLMSLLVERLD